MKFLHRNSVLFAAAFLLALGAGEGVLRLIPPFWLPFLMMPAVQQTHSEPSANPELRYIPRAGHSGPFSSHEFHTWVAINSRHMRDREYPLEKKEGVPRIAFFGDSFVFGWGVEEKETAAALLEARDLQNVEVLNFGVSGYCTSQILEWLKIQGVRFKPDIVLFLTEGSPSRCVTDVKFDGGRMYWEWVPRNSFWDRGRAWAARHSYLAGFLTAAIPEARRRLREAFAGAPPDVPEPPLDPDLGLDILAELKALGIREGFVPVVINYHEAPEVRDGLDARDQIQMGAMEAWCQREGVRYLDLIPLLRKAWAESGRSPYFRYDPHWNAWGHDLVARIVAAYMEREGLLPAGSFRQKTPA